MDCPNTTISLNKDKRIGKVLFIVEGEKTEPYILCRIFEKIFDYHYTRISRQGKMTYDVVSSKRHDLSQVFVVNAAESNISNIKSGNEYLDRLFTLLINEHSIDFENAAIFYLWDRDCESNADKTAIRELLSSLRNPRDSFDYERQGLLLLSYPSVEAYTASGFITDAYKMTAATGKTLKRELHTKNILQNNISEDTVEAAVRELQKSLWSFEIDFSKMDIDDMADTNLRVFNGEERFFQKNGMYRLLSMLSVALINLGLIEIGT